MNKGILRSVQLCCIIAVALFMTACANGDDTHSAAESVCGHIVDIRNKTTYPGEIIIKDGIIDTILVLDRLPDDAPHLLPGFVDAHVHIESSMLTPANFAKLALSHGTVAVVADPHEITNVLGEEGLEFMIENAASSRFVCHFGLPSCVPSSHLETAGAVIDASATERLLRKPGIHFLAEMMNYPGVISSHPETMAKISAAVKLGMPVDGHAPGVTGADLDTYIAAGISTDHECSTVEEARERISKGMKVIIREGSSARNFDALYPVIADAPEMVMLCSDDKHPDDLIESHIDGMVRKGLKKGLSVWDLLRAACLNPVQHYALPTGEMRKGDKATFIAVDNLRDLNVLAAYIDGKMVYDNGRGVLEENLSSGAKVPESTPNNFKADKITSDDITVDTSGAHSARVIVAEDGQLLTSSKTVDVTALDTPQIQKIVVYNRYGSGTPQVAYIEGFNITKGAIAATIAHDSHNIIAIGATDEEIVDAINSLIEVKGGIIAVNNGKKLLLTLPIAGLMSTDDGPTVANRYRELLAAAKDMGCSFRSPFITMSFMALPVIPQLKLTDKGLVDVNLFDFVPLLIL